MIMVTYDYRRFISAVADVLFGDHPFTGKLPCTWPRTATQQETPDHAAPLLLHSTTHALSSG
jgi:hypothetical protein